MEKMIIYVGKLSKFSLALHSEALVNTSGQVDFSSPDLDYQSTAYFLASIVYWDIAFLITISYSVGSSMYIHMVIFIKQRIHLCPAMRKTLPGILQLVRFKPAFDKS